jgi:4a-hydroxytetrahydrobiopterin dehydratase
LRPGARRSNGWGAGKRKRGGGANSAGRERHGRRLGGQRPPVNAGFEGWKGNAGRNAIALEFRYADFNQAFAFVTEIAPKTEQMNRYNRVSVLLSARACAGERHIGSGRFADTLAT